MKVLKNIILYIGLAVTAILCILMISYRTFFTMEIDTVRRTTHNSIILLPVIAAVLALLILIRPLLQKIRPNRLFLFFVLVYIAAGCYLIFNIPLVLTADQYMTMKHAILTNSGDYSGFLKYHYLSYYPFNLCLMSFEKLLLLVTDDLRFFYFVYLALCLGENWFIYRIISMIYKGNQLAINYSITLLFVFVPKFLYILFIYNEGPGAFCACAGLYFAMKIVDRNDSGNAVQSRKKDILDAVFGGLFLALGCRFRMNYLIVVIALAILMILWWFSHKKAWSVFILLLVTVLGFGALSKGITAYYEKKSGMEIEGIPMNLTIAMGLQDSEMWPGWFNGYETDTYDKYEQDGEKAAEEASEYISNRISEFISDPAMAIDFFARKTISAWTDPMFQSAWIGPKNDDGKIGDCRTEILNSLYQGDWVYIILDWFMNALNVIILASSFVYLLFKKKLTGQPLRWVDLFPVLYLTGGFLFHQFWEIKSQYVYGYVFAMTITAAGLFSTLRIGKKSRAETTGAPGKHVTEEESNSGKE